MVLTHLHFTILKFPLIGGHFLPSTLPSPPLPMFINLIWTLTAAGVFCILFVSEADWCPIVPAWNWTSHRHEHKFMYNIDTHIYTYIYYIYIIYILYIYNICIYVLYHIVNTHHVSLDIYIYIHIYIYISWISSCKSVYIIYNGRIYVTIIMCIYIYTHIYLILFTYVICTRKR